MTPATRVISTVAAAVLFACLLGLVVMGLIPGAAANPALVTTGAVLLGLAALAAPVGLVACVAGAVLARRGAA